MEEPNSAGSCGEQRVGGCFCGAIRYVAKGKPLNVRACHCEDCQRLTGSAFFVRALYPTAAIAVTGTPSVYWSSDDLMRMFCPNCGSKLFARRKSNPSATAVALGSFDDRSGFEPSAHIWTCDRQPWLILPEGIPQYVQAYTG
jgi:hypothetical protein